MSQLVAEPSEELPPLRRSIQATTAEPSGLNRSAIEQSALVPEILRGGPALSQLKNTVPLATYAYANVPFAAGKTSNAHRPGASASSVTSKSLSIVVDWTRGGP